MIKFLLTLLIFVTIHTVCAEIVINEVCYDPIGADDGYEWIELFNNGASEINLIGWKIYTGGASFQEDYEFPSIIIRPGRFIIIAESKVEHAHLRAELSLQNASPIVDGVCLVSPDSSYTDTILYGLRNDNELPDDLNTIGHSFAPDPTQGYSLARIPNGVDTDIISDDFFACENPTPGYRNFREIDLSFKSVEYSIIPGKIEIFTVILNKSTWDVDNSECYVKIFKDNVYHSKASISSIKALTETDTVIYVDNDEDYNYELKLELFHSEEINNVDNLWVTQIINASYALYINEILPYPASNQQEWIELHNPDRIYVPANLISIEDEVGNISAIDKPIINQEYIVLCTDSIKITTDYPNCPQESIYQLSSLPMMNNNGDCLILKSGSRIDSVFYSGNHVIQGTSMFRNNQSNEMICYETEHFNSPGQENFHNNSDFVWGIEISSSNALEHKITFHNIEEVMEGDITCIGKDIETDIEFLLFSKFITITENSTITISSDNVRKGYYNLIYSFNNDVKTCFWAQDKIPVVVNEIMFNPVVGEPEWIELYSKVNETFSSELIISEDTLTINFNSDGYSIITGTEVDIDFLSNNYVNNAVMYKGLPSLLNSGEKITVVSSCSSIQESFIYDVTISPEKGVSIERSNPDVCPVNTNWGASISELGHTICELNSIYREYIPQSSNVVIRPNPFSPYRGESCDIVFTLEKSEANVSCKVFDLEGRHVYTIVSNQLISGTDMLMWDGRIRSGKMAFPGSYLLFIEINDGDETIKKQIPFAIGY